MHTLVFWAAALSLIPLAMGVGLQVLGRLRDAMAPPASNISAAAPPRGAAAGPR